MFGISRKQSFNKLLFLALIPTSFQISRHETKAFCCLDLYCYSRSVLYQVLMNFPEKRSAPVINTHYCQAEVRLRSASTFFFCQDVYFFVLPASFTTVLKIGFSIRINYLCCFSTIANFLGSTFPFLFTGSSSFTFFLWHRFCHYEIYFIILFLFLIMI